MLSIRTLHFSIRSIRQHTYTWAQAVVGYLEDHLVVLPNASTYCHLFTSEFQLLHLLTIQKPNVHLHLPRALTRPAETHVISDAHLLRCQYLYFFTSEARTFVLVKQVYLSAGQLRPSSLQPAFAEFLKVRYASSL